MSRMLRRDYQRVNTCLNQRPDEKTAINAKNTTNAQNENELGRMVGDWRYG